MNKMEEAYVSFETAKLLKEKGFNEPIRCWYDNFQDFHEEGMRMSNADCLPPTIMCPTQQMAMAWLREVHNIGIFPSTYTHISDRKTIHSYGTAIINLKTYELMTDSYLSSDTYEESVESALKYCLENLI